MDPKVLGLAAAALAWVASVSRPGWTARPRRALRRVAWLALGAAYVAAGALLGMCLDATARRAVLGWAAAQTSLLEPVGVWLRGPALPDALLVGGAVGAAVVVDGLAPGALRLARLRPIAGGAILQGRRLAMVFLPLLPLLLAWADVILATAGAPDLRVPALACWLAAGLVAVDLSRPGLPGRRLWLLVPAAAGVLGAVARPAAVTTAAAAFAVVAGVAIAHAWQVARRETGRSWPAVAPLLERIALLAILCLALASRWTPELAEPLSSSDANGYFNMARDFHARVRAEATNPIALAYLNIHPAAREPLFILILRGVFDVLGESPVHQRTLTVLASVACVWLTYAFGRLALGALAGLGAALMLALVPWHAEFARQGLREEFSLLFVYGLALLVLWPRTGGWPRAVLAGALAAAAVLTRIDAGAVVTFLLLAWSGRLWPSRRRILLSWGTFVVLLAPLLVGYRLRTGEALAPLGSALGGDIRASMTPLLRGEIPPLQVLQYLAAGTTEVYAGTIFSGVAAYAGPLAGLALATLVASYVAGLAWLTWRGPRLLPALSLLGAYAPPFAYIAGIAVLGGPGSGYTERYTYLIIPAVLAISAWATGRLVLAAGSRLRGVARSGAAFRRTSQVSTPKTATLATARASGVSPRASN